MDRLLVEDFLAAYSGHTLAAYRSDLADYLSYCRSHRIEPLAATRADLAAYLQTLRDSGRTPATLARRLVALRGLYRLAVDEYGLGTSPAERIRIRRPRTLSRISALNRPELRAFLAAADPPVPGRRDSPGCWPPPGYGSARPATPSGATSASPLTANGGSTSPVRTPSAEVSPSTQRPGNESMPSEAHTSRCSRPAPVDH